MRHFDFTEVEDTLTVNHWVFMSLLIYKGLCEVKMSYHVLNW
jgi:hypothetical protein